MLSRAHLPRIAFFVALFLTAITTGTVAREFRAADTQSEDYPTVRALHYGQVRTALATKLIDGAENNWPSFVTTDHYKYAGFYTLTEHTMSPEVLAMSRKAWASLTGEDRQIFRQAARESSHFMHERRKDLEEQSRCQAQEAGVTIVSDFDRKPFEAAAGPIYANVRRDPAAAELIDRIRKVN